MKILLGYPRADYTALYSALANRGLRVAGVADTLAGLCALAAKTAGDLVILWADMAGSPIELQGAMQTLAPTPVAVVLPSSLAHSEEKVWLMQPKPLAVWRAEANEVEPVAGAAAALTGKLAAEQGQASAPSDASFKDNTASAFAGASQPTHRPKQPNAHEDSLRSLPAPRRTASMALAVGSGSAGGSGKSTIAAELAALAAERMQTVLVGLNEPGGVVAGLGARPRPDLLDIIDGAEVPQRRGRLQLIPAPSEPSRIDALLERSDAPTALFESLAAAYDLVVFDLPPALSAAPVCEVLAASTINARMLYVLCPTAADGAVASRVFAAPQMPIHVIWNRPQPGGLSIKAVRQGIEAAAVAFPPVLGTLPYHKGVGAARNRQQLLSEAAADGLIPSALLAEFRRIACNLFGWQPEPEDKSSFRLPGIKVKVVD